MPDEKIVKAIAQELHRYLAISDTHAQIIAGGVVVAYERNQRASGWRPNEMRNAALEEAAQVAEALDPEKPANWLYARHKIAFHIRALKAPPALDAGEKGDGK